MDFSKWFLSLALVTAVSACNSPEYASIQKYGVDPETAPESPWEAPEPDLDETLSMAAQVLERTNAFRAENGQAPLSLNAELTAAAQAYAERMAAEGFFSHTSPDGTTVGERITDAGYNWRTYGENIAYGYASADAVMQGWIGSAGHRANLLNAGFKDLGVGYAESRSGTPYWVQNFGAR